MNSDDHRERLSALVDGELDEAETQSTIEQILSDAALRRRWRRYHMVNEAVRRVPPVRGSEDIAARVRAAMETEAAFPAFPGRAADAPVPLPVRPPRAVVGASARRSRVGPVVGFALAASVAVAAVLGLRTLMPPETTAPVPLAANLAPPQPQTAPAVAPSADPDMVTRVSARGVAPVANGMRWNIRRPGVEARLNGYLVNHSEYLGNGIRGMLPYARIVAYDATSE